MARQAMPSRCRVDFIGAARLVSMRPNILRKWLHKPAVVQFIRRERAAFRVSICAANEFALRNRENECELARGAFARADHPKNRLFGGRQGKCARQRRCCEGRILSGIDHRGSKNGAAEYFGGARFLGPQQVHCARLVDSRCCHRDCELDW